MGGILKVGPAGLAVIACQLLLFYSLIRCSLEVSRKTRPLLRTLSHSLAEFKDRFGDEDSVVTRARTRYRRALQEIDKVDTQLITSSMLSYTEAVRILGVKMSFTEFDQFVRSGPSILITLGLLGTFIGLTGNLSELSQILDSAKLSPAESLLRASAILSPMATAFISSLVAVSLSLLVWAFGTIKGVNTIVSDLNELMGAYLDQVIQANSKRYSLMRESLERMEIYLTEFMATFTERVGNSIDRALRDKLGEVFDSLSKSANAQAKFVIFLEEGGNSLHQAGNAFERASMVFSKSSFATEFADATQQFILSTTDISKRSSQLSQSASQLDIVLNSLRDSCLQGTRYFVELGEAMKKQSEVTSSVAAIANNTLKSLEDATKQLREARLAVGRDARANEVLTEKVTDGMVTLHSGMERVAMSLDSVATRSDDIIKNLSSNMLSITNQVATLSTSIEATLRALESPNINGNSLGSLPRESQNE